MLARSDHDYIWAWEARPSWLDLKISGQARPNHTSEPGLGLDFLQYSEEAWAEAQHAFSLMGRA
jgi:hypothetical protein